MNTGMQNIKETLIVALAEYLVRDTMNRLQDIQVIEAYSIENFEEEILVRVKISGEWTTLSFNTIELVDTMYMEDMLKDFAKENCLVVTDTIRNLILEEC